MKKHIARAAPLWREALPDAPAFTECGRVSGGLVVVPRAEFREGVTRRELSVYRLITAVGRSRLGPNLPNVDHLEAFCGTCMERFEAHYSVEWHVAPAAVVYREADSTHGVVALTDELNALAAMALAAPEAFADAVRRERMLRGIQR